MAKRKMSTKQRAALARGRKKQAARRKAKGKGQFCMVVRKGSKSTTRCYKSGTKLFDAVKAQGNKSLDAITLYKRKNG